MEHGPYWEADSRGGSKKSPIFFGTRRPRNLFAKAH